MGRILRWLAGFVSGMGFGALLALMWAPYTGPELRTRLEERVLLVLEEGRRAADTRRQELQHRLQEASQMPKRTP
ncbi:MAG: YtxH domain-containing protein [Chloroflexi bacterium]|nr:YtxH domain-containing protein [Chloroflexota bacterium]